MENYGENQWSSSGSAAVQAKVYYQQPQQAVSYVVDSQTRMLSTGSTPSYYYAYMGQQPSGNQLATVGEVYSANGGAMSHSLSSSSLQNSASINYGGSLVYGGGNAAVHAVVPVGQMAPPRASTPLPGHCGFGFPAAMYQPTDSKQLSEVSATSINSSGIEAFGESASGLDGSVLSTSHQSSRPLQTRNAANGSVFAHELVGNNGAKLSLAYGGGKVVQADRPRAFAQRGLAKSENDSGVQMAKAEKGVASDESADRIFVGGLSNQTTDDELKYFFERKIGKVEEVKIIRDSNGASKCYGFVTFVKTADAERVLAEAEKDCTDDSTWVLGRRKLNVGRAVRRMPSFERTSSTLSIGTPAAQNVCVLPEGIQLAYSANGVPFLIHNGVAILPEGYSITHHVVPAQPQPVYQIVAPVAGSGSIEQLAQPQAITLLQQAQLPYYQQPQSFGIGSSTSIGGSNVVGACASVGYGSQQRQALGNIGNQMAFHGSHGVAAATTSLAGMKMEEQ